MNLPITIKGFALIGRQRDERTGEPEQNPGLRVERLEMHELCLLLGSSFIQHELERWKVRSRHEPATIVITSDIMKGA
jgi:hypothetical protein